MMLLFLDNIHRWGDVAFNVDFNTAKGLLTISGAGAHLLDRFGINADECCTEAMNEISCPSQTWAVYGGTAPFPPRWPC
jgi:hypothetical protein